MKRTDNIRYFVNQPGKSKSVAYCHCNAHKGNISVKTLKKHECLRKQCPYLEKYEDHDYWRQRQTLKDKKKEKKLMAA